MKSILSLVMVVTIILGIGFAVAGNGGHVAYEQICHGAYCVRLPK